jgi:hypothetical protein
MSGADCRWQQRSLSIHTQTESLEPRLQGLEDLP